MKPVLFAVRSLPEVTFEALRELYDVRTCEGVVRDRARLLEAARGAATLVLTYLDPVDAALLDALPGLRHVASYGVGVNHIDLEACRARGVLVTNTPGVVTNATADLAMALLLAAARRVAEGDRAIRAGAWTALDPGWLLGLELAGKTLGIVGFGRIGQAVARRAAGFQLRILYASPREARFPGATRVGLDELLAQSDYVSLHAPLTPATDCLLSRARIAGMKRGAILVNTARGQVVDDAALAEALASGHLAAAGLDVFRDEPRVSALYLALPNVVLTPHIGSGSRETRRAMSTMVLDEVARVGRGEQPLHRVP